MPGENGPGGSSRAEAVGGPLARAVRTFQFTFVRWHARGLSMRRGGWAAMFRASVAMVATVLVVVTIAQGPTQTCEVPVGVGVDLGGTVGEADAVTPGRALLVVGWWLGAIVLAVVAMRRVVVMGQRRSMWMYPNWRRRIQGAVLATAGRWAVFGVLIALLAVIASGACEVPEWFSVLTTAALVAGLVLGVLGAAVATEAGWVGFALVLIVDLLSAALLAGFALLLAGEGQPALIGALAFTIHGTCTAFACRWSFKVGTMPGSRADDRAKAGETGRTLCALWVLLLIAMIVVIFDEDLVDRAVTLLTSPVVVALTLGALAVTLGSGHTKYVEAREAAGRRIRDRRAAKARTFDRRDDLVPRIAARMIAACGPLATGELVAGVDRMAGFALPERRLRRELGASDLLVRQPGDDIWDLAPGIDPGAHRWPTDRRLQALAGDDRLSTRGLVDRLDAAGYQGLAVGGYLRSSHPLVNRSGRLPARRWSVRPGRLLE